MNIPEGQHVVVVPAAGVGKRMQAQHPKQYLVIDNKTILEHTVNRLLAHEQIAHVVIVLGPNDEYFAETALATHQQVSCVIGGKERVDSVLAGLKALVNVPWVLVHDAARPCVLARDISALIKYCLDNQQGAILAAPVRDTMKQANEQLQISETLDRSNMWHALTPQMYKTTQLIAAIEDAQYKQLPITDESSAIEAAGLPSGIVSASSDNIKITRPEDLALAAFILKQQSIGK